MFESVPPDNERATGTSEINWFKEFLLIIFDVSFRKVFKVKLKKLIIFNLLSFKIRSSLAII